MNKTAVQVHGLTKSFRLPHERIDTLRGVFVNLLKKNSYENFKALDNISFDIKQGEFFSILGKNGSGKSTLLKLLAGIYTPDEGEIITQGKVAPFLELGIGFNPRLSGRENVFLNGTLLGIPREQLQEKYEDIVRFAELERFMDQKVQNYSSGMRVRLAFSVAIHAERDILLMDEVLAVGDANFKEKCLGVLDEFRAQGKTIIFVSHGMGPVREHSDRAMILHEGKMIGIGDVQDVAQQYQEHMNSLLSVKTAQSQTTVSAPITVTEEKAIENTKKETALLNTITNVSFFNDEKDNLTVFKSGEHIGVEVTVSLDTVPKNLHLGIAVTHKNTDMLVAGNNSFFDKEDIKWKKGENTIRLQLNNTPFHQGEYYVAISLFAGHPKNGQYFDRYSSKEEEQYFEVIPKDNNGGIITIDHNWSTR